MTRWACLSDSAKTEIALDCQDNPEILAEKAHALGCSPKTLKRRIQEHTQNVKTPAVTKPKSKLVDDRLENSEWGAALTRFQKDRWVKVMHLCDIHTPFQHDPALNVAYKLLDYLQPHICVVGSDFADFPGLSSFRKDPDITSPSENVLDVFEEHWRAHMYELRERSPDTVYVFILGNHERRLYDYVNDNAPQVRKEITEKFQHIIVSAGALWIGEVDSVRIGPLLVHHGNRSGINAAQRMLDDIAHQCSIMTGHTHQISTVHRRGEDFPVVGATSGCLTHYPHYFKRSRMHRPWMLGTAVAEVDLMGRAVNIDNIEFQLEPNCVWVRYQDELFVSDPIKSRKKR